MLISDITFALETIGYWYILTVQTIRSRLETPATQTQIHQVLLHSQDQLNMDLTPYIESDRLSFQDLRTFLEKHLTNTPIWNENHEIHLEIVYYQGDNKYRIVYDQTDKIEFPPYHGEEAIYSHSNIMADSYQNGVLFADYGGQDVTELIKEYAGPLGNFYRDKDIYLSLDKIKYGLHVYRDNTGHTLVVTDNYAQDHVFQEGQKIVLETPDIKI